MRIIEIARLGYRQILSLPYIVIGVGRRGQDNLGETVVRAPT